MFSKDRWVSLLILSLLLLGVSGSLQINNIAIVSQGTKAQTTTPCYPVTCKNQITFQTAYTNGVTPKVIVAVTELSYNTNQYNPLSTTGFNIETTSITNSKFKMNLVITSVYALYQLKLSHLSYDNSIVTQFLYSSSTFQSPVNLNDPYGGDVSQIINIETPIQNPSSSTALIFINGFTIMAPLDQQLKIFTHLQGSIDANGFKVKIETGNQNTLRTISYSVILIDNTLATNNDRSYTIASNQYFSMNTNNVVQNSISQQDIFIGLSKIVYKSALSTTNSYCGFKFNFNDNGTIQTKDNFKQIYLSYILLNQIEQQQQNPDPTPIQNIVPDQNIQYFTDSIVTMKQQSLIKDPISNTIILSLKIYNLSQNIISQESWENIISLGLPSSSQISYQYDKTSGVLKAAIKYNQNLQNLTLKASLNVPTITEPVELQYKINADNNLAAHVYSSQMYKNVQVTKNFMYVVLPLSYFAFFFGIYASKIVVVQMMGVLQLSYLGLYVLSYSDPLIAPLYLLKYSNGYNKIFNSEQGITPNSIYQVGMNSSVIGNFNVMFGIAFIPLIATIILYIISKKRHDLSIKATHWYRLSLGQWNMLFTIFCLYEFTSLVTIFGSYTTKSSGSIFVLDIFISSVFGILIIFSLILYLITDFNYMGQFKYMFKWNTFDFIIYAVMIISRVLFSIAFTLGNGNFLSAVAVIAALFVIGILFSIRKPYANRMHTARSVINIIISIAIISCYLILSLRGPTLGNDFYSKIPIIVLTLIILTILMALGFIIKDLIDYVQNKKYQKTVMMNNTMELDKKRQQQLQMKMLNDLLQQQKRYKNQNKTSSLAKKMWLKKRKDKQKQKKKRERQQEIQTKRIEQKTEAQPIIEQQKIIALNTNPIIQETQSGMTVERVMILDKLLRNGEL